MTGKKKDVEALWLDLFSNPSQWWDHRPEKMNPRFPDFKHKQTGKALWLDDAKKSLWVQAELAAIPPGTLQSNAFTWAQKLKRCVKSGQYMKTIEVFQEMQQEGVCPDTWTFPPVLNACARLGALEEGKHLHTQIIQARCDSDIYVATCLVDMYAKCGSIEDAWRVFNKMQDHDVVSWSTMITGYVKCGQGKKAMELFVKMQHEGVEPSTVTFTAVLNACASVAALDEGRCVHEQIIRRGCESDVYVATCLVDMYAKCGSIKDAWSVFNKMQERNVVSWSAMIAGYVKSGQGLKAIELFWKMQQEGVEPTTVTFVGVLNACASVEALEEGRVIHEQIVKRGCESNIYVANCLVDMYAKCRNIGDAWSVFNKMTEHDVVSWNAMIGGCVQSEHGLKALDLFRKMQQEGVEPSPITFVGVLHACACVADLEEGRCVHEQIIQRGCESDVYVATCLVDMYAKCGSIGDAWSVFNKMRERNVVSWSAMIGAYAKSGQGLKAMELFEKMQQDGVEPDPVTFIGALNACASVAALEEGRRVHEQIVQRGCESDVYVANCLVDMYAKCGSIEDAWGVFNKMGEHNVVSWNAIIWGCVKSEQGLKAIELFRRMQQEGVEPSTITFVGVLNAYASLMDLEECRRVHEQIIQRGCDSNVYVAACLVDMYVKCGSVKDAWSVFSKMSEHTAVSWSAMIGGYAKSGQGRKAMQLFQKMKQEGVEPDSVTFVGVLNACASLAALEEGRCVHEEIIQRGYESEIYVANCLVDMYAKCRSIEDAWVVFNKMREHDVISWNAMIGAYVKCGQGLKAVELFRKMQQEGVEPSMITFIEVLTACASVAALEEGRRAHEGIIHRGFESDVYIATCLVDMYAKCGSIEDAWSVFETMRKHDIVSCNAMIGGFAMHGHAKKAIGLFKSMSKEEVEMNEITFTCLLSACSHGGLVKEGVRYFNSMASCRNVLPAVEHYACMVDLLGRAGWLEEAEEIMQRLPMERDAALWRSFLGACRNHGDIEMAERAAKRCWELDPENASAHVLLSNIYAAAEKCEE